MGFQRTFKESYSKYVQCEAQRHNDETKSYEMATGQVLVTNMNGAGPCNSSGCITCLYRPDEE